VQIIAGLYRGTHLLTLEGNDTRPTTGRVREALFNSLAFDIPGSVFMDVCAGSGAMGLEALSRGAEFVIFIESAPQAIAIIEANLKKLKISPDSYQLLKSTAQHIFGQPALLKRSPMIVYMDPPYDLNPVDFLEPFSNSPVSQTTELILFEHLKTIEPQKQLGKFQQTKQKKYAKTKVSFYGLL
jgi:16S rRNA (guanine966-N2)-methyltransferase